MADETPTIPVDTTTVIAPAVTDTPAVVQTDTQKAIVAVEAALAALKSAGGDYVTAEISRLTTVLSNLKIKAAAEVTVLETEVKTIEVAEKTFIEKYGNAILNGAEIVLLVALVAKIFNII